MSAEVFLPDDIDRLVTFVHPMRVAQAGPQIEDLEDYTGIKAEIFATWEHPERSREEFQRIIAPTLGKTTLFVPFGGDGIANQTADFFCDPDISDEARETSILFTSCGGACDTAKSLNTPSLLKDPYKVLASANAQTVDINPLNVRFQTPNGQRQQKVLSYFGIGTDAAGAVAMNEAKPDLRKLIKNHTYLGPLLQRAREPGIVLPPACISPTFDLEEIDAQHPQSATDVMEWLIGNGSHMARYGRFPTNLTTTEVSVATVQTSVRGPLRAPSVILNGLKLTRAALPFEQYDMAEGSRSWEIQNIQQTRADAPLYAQWDGETSVVNEGKVTISRANTLRVLTTQALMAA